MKILKLSSIILSSLMFFSVLSSCGGNDSKKETVTEIAPENILVSDYQVDGMVCAMGCAKTIQDELLGMNGIAACSVNFEEGKAHIEFDKTQLSEQEIIAKIEGLAKGQYKISPWTEKTPIENTEDEVSGETEAPETVAEVSFPTLKIPNIVSFLLNQL